MSLLQEVATRAAKVPKTTAHSRLIRLIESLDEKDVTLTDEDTWALQAIYAYFMPVPPAKPKSLVGLVTRFVAKDAIRYYLNALYSTGTHLYATDSNRAIRIPTDLPAGFYDKALTSIEVDGKFPDIDRIIPKSDKGHTRHHLVAAELPVEVSGSKDHCYMVHEGVYIEKSLMDDILKFSPEIDVLVNKDSRFSPIQVVLPGHPKVDIIIAPYRFVKRQEKRAVTAREK